MKDDKGAQIVHFPHPGGECPVPETGTTSAIDVQWNISGPHCRRLVGHFGEYVGTDGRLGRGDLVFWTEWEAATSAVALANGRDPFSARFLHTVKNPVASPSMNRSGDCRVCCSNTDPCVFGSTFKYSNCKQRSDKKLRSLSDGSLIMFGSRINGQFVLDTVFVVDGQGQPYSRISEPDVSDEYRILTLDALGDSVKDPPLVFYRGARYKTGASSIYSFTPAKVRNAGASELGKRCIIDVTALNEAAGKSVLDIESFRRPTVHTFGASVVEKVWGELKRQVFSNGFVLGVHFDWPKR